MEGLMARSLNFVIGRDPLAQLSYIYFTQCNFSSGAEYNFSHLNMLKGPVYLAQVCFTAGIYDLKYFMTYRWWEELFRNQILLHHII